MAPILYYSPKCQHCQKMLREYNTNGFQLVNIDQQQFPKYVTSVPCIEDNKKLHTGQAAFELVKQNDNVEPFGFNAFNNMNKGFSFVDADNEYYTEQVDYVEIN